jgi:hypothetical protein
METTRVTGTLGPQGSSDVHMPSRVADRTGDILASMRSTGGELRNLWGRVRAAEDARVAAEAALGGLRDGRYRGTSASARRQS